MTGVDPHTNADNRFVHLCMLGLLQEEEVEGQACYSCKMKFALGRLSPSFIPLLQQANLTLQFSVLTRCQYTKQAKAVLTTQWE